MFINGYGLTGVSQNVCVQLNIFIANFFYPDDGIKVVETLVYLISFFIPLL